MSGKFLAGVGIACCTTAMNAGAMTLQKLAHLDVERRRDAARREGRSDADIAGDKAFKVTRKKKWLLGLCFMGAASLLSLAVFALVGQSTSSAFAALTIVWSLIFSRAFLKEVVAPFDIAVACLMIVGTVLAVAM